MKRLQVLLGLMMIGLGACNGKPVLSTPPSFPVPVTSSPVSSSDKQVDLGITFSAAPEERAVIKPEPILLPALEMSIDLRDLSAPEMSAALHKANPFFFEDAHPLALDALAGRLYVSLNPMRTVVLDSTTLKRVDEIALGGTLAVDSERQRLYIGVGGHGSPAGSGDQVLKPSRLCVFDTTNLRELLSRTVFTDTAAWPMIAIDSQAKRLYVARGGIYILDADTLAVLDILRDTLPGPQTEVPTSSGASDVLLDPQRQRLYGVTHWGAASHYYRYDLSIYDLASRQKLAQESSVRGWLNSALALDQKTGAVYTSLEDGVGRYDLQTKTFKQVVGIQGDLQFDPQQGRLYVYGPTGLTTFDRDLNLLGSSSFAASLEDKTGVVSFLVDPKHDRLFVLKGDGHLLVMKGQAATESQPPRDEPVFKHIAWLVPSPNYDIDHLLYAGFQPDFGAFDKIAIFRSRDSGMTWEFVDGLPIDKITTLTFSPDFVHDQTLWVTARQFYNMDSYGVFRSTDGGVTWHSASFGLGDLNVREIVASPDYRRDHTVSAVTNDEVYRSSDGGLTWGLNPSVGAGAAIPWSVPQAQLEFAPDERTVFALLPHAVLRSTDEGVSWLSVGQDLPLERDGSVVALSLSVSPGYTSDKRVVIQLSDQRQYFSQDGGTTWQRQ
ncbi:hypothetical protein TFLX_02359 [Thermoflexales bacterium]|nr:hypothetical protein TFLX_02359 [Thermoflexales bacterium]